MDKINFTPEKFDKLKEAYQKALSQKTEIFTFEGHEIVTNYAKYMIEYLNTKFK